MQTQEVVAGALLSALSLVIPLAFGGALGVVIPPFSATLASHVPLMLSMLVSPMAAAMVGVVSAVGFAMKLGPVVGARAAMHVLVGLAGASLVRRRTRFPLALLACMPVHALAEALIVLPFGWSLQKAGVVVAAGTALHHAADSIIALSVAGIVEKTGLMSWNPGRRRA